MAKKRIPVRLNGRQTLCNVAKSQNLNSKIVTWNVAQCLSNVESYGNLLFCNYHNTDIYDFLSRIKGSLHRFGYRNFCVNVYTCISVVRLLIDVNLGLN